jgi:hypothetical protein
MVNYNVLKIRHEKKIIDLFEIPHVFTIFWQYEIRRDISKNDDNEE